ncbi:MAG: DUF4340 domain-containing protein, partial [bacterium]
AKAAENSKLLFKSLDPSATSEILLRKAGSADVLLRKVQGQWRLITPTAAPADPNAVGAILTELASAKRDEIVVDKGADLRDFGLDKPSGEVTFKPATPGAKAEVLFFGMNDPEGNEAYGMIDGQPAVFLTDLYVKNAVLKSGPDLRDKSVWSFNADDVQAVRSNIGDFSLGRDKQGFWRVQSGSKNESAKPSAVSGWLDNLSRLRADSVPSETGIGSFGLKHAKTLVLTLKGGVSLTLKEGAKAKPGPGFYVQVAGQGPVFQLPEYLRAQVEEKGSALMDLAAFGFDTTYVTRFEVKRAHGTLTAVKNKTSGTWAWDPAAPIKPGQKPFDFAGFLSGLADTQFLKRLSADQRPLSPTASVSLYADGGVLLERADFGARSGPGQIAASSSKRQVVLV